MVNFKYFGRDTFVDIDEVEACQFDESNKNYIQVKFFRKSGQHLII